MAKGRLDGRIGNSARWSGRKASLMPAKNCTRKIRMLCTKVSEVDWNAMPCSRTGGMHDEKHSYIPQRTDPNRPPAAQTQALERSMSVIGASTDM